MSVAKMSWTTGAARLFPLLLLLSCGDPMAPGANEIVITDNTFTPATLEITEGSVVTWRWAGSVAHNVTFESDAAPNSDTQGTGSIQRGFTTTGTVTYYCSIHGSATGGMRGTIIVRSDSLSGAMRRGIPQ